MSHLCCYIVQYYGASKKPALSVAKLSEMYPGVLDSEYKSLWAPIEDLETMEAFLSRTRGVVDKLVEAEKAGLVGGEIALFTHAATVQGLVIALLDDPSYSFRCPVCGITTLRRDTSNGKWVLESPPSAAHLSGGEEHLWSFADMKK